MKSHASRHAFTLIELLVVIAVVVIMASLILGAIVMVRQYALRTECASNLRQLGVAIHAYASDNNGEIPAMYGPNRQQGRPISWFNVGMDKDGNGYGGMWLLIKEPLGLGTQSYLPDTNFFFCPGDSIGPARIPVQSMSYCYSYVPKGGGSYLPMGFHPSVPPPTSAYQWQDGALSGLERHNIKGVNAATTAILVEGTAMHRIGHPWFKFHGQGGNILSLDGHVTYARIEMTDNEWGDADFCIAAADKAVAGD